MVRPDPGCIDSGERQTGEVRWRLPGIGKRGDIRVIYCRFTCCTDLHAAVLELVTSIQKACEIKCCKTRPGRQHGLGSAGEQTSRMIIGLSWQQFAMLIGTWVRTLQNSQQGKNILHGL